MDLHPAAHSAALSARTTFRPLSRCFYLRRLLINGASANLLRSKATKADPWVIGIRRRRPPLVVAVALANKTARIAWAVMLRQKEYQPRALAAWPGRRRWSLRESNDA